MRIFVLYFKKKSDSKNGYCNFGVIFFNSTISAISTSNTQKLLQNVRKETFVKSK